MIITYLWFYFSTAHLCATLLRTLEENSNIFIDDFYKIWVIVSWDGMKKIIVIDLCRVTFRWLAFCMIVGMDLFLMHGKG